MVFQETVVFSSEIKYSGFQEVNGHKPKNADAFSSPSGSDDLSEKKECEPPGFALVRDCAHRSKGVGLYLAIIGLGVTA
jgi:hypothetical protein